MGIWDSFFCWFTSLLVTLILVKLKEKKLLKIQPLPKVLRVQSYKSNYVTYIKQRLHCACTVFWREFQRKELRRALGLFPSKFCLWLIPLGCIKHSPVQALQLFCTLPGLVALSEIFFWKDFWNMEILNRGFSFKNDSRTAPLASKLKVNNESKRASAPNTTSSSVLETVERYLASIRFEYTEPISLLLHCCSFFSPWKMLWFGPGSGSLWPACTHLLIYHGAGYST
jgi:hypothetical protein